MDLHIARASMAIVQHVPPEAIETYKEWRREVAVVMEGFPGYQRTDTYPPSEGDDEWVTIVHFGDHASLEHWLESPVRAEWIAKLRANVGEFELQKFSGGFGQWFANLSRTSQRPPGWKMALTVLFSLYPTVMLLTIFARPHLSPLGVAFYTLIGNTIGVATLQWVIMPPLVKLLGPWLKANTEKTRALSIGGAVAMVLILGVLAVIFRQATG